MADNPFFKLKEAEYRYYAIAFLKKLKYLDYELIDDETRNNATEKHREEFNEQEAQKNQEGTVSDEQERQADPALKDAKIDCTVSMIARILREDVDSKLLSSMPKFAETLAPYDTNIEENTQKFQHEMKGRNKEKLNTIVNCEQVLRTSEKQAEKDSIALIDRFINLRKHAFLKKLPEVVPEGMHIDYAGFKKGLNSEIEVLEDDLMGVELKLQEALQVSTSDFQERVKKIIEDMKQKTGQYIKEVQDEMEQFSVALKVYALQEFDRIANMEEDQNGGDTESMSDNMIILMGDNDVLNQHLEQSKENVDSKIGD